MKKINPVSKYFLTLISMFRTNIRDYGMYIALSVIFIIFSIMTYGVFLGPINFTNLLNQTAYVSVLAVGMTLVIVTRQIDLSVGFLGAFLGAYVVVAVENQGQYVGVALLGALLITIVVGIIKGYFVANVKVPAFVVTLAGMFVFKGFLMLKTNQRTIPATNTFFSKIGTGYLTKNIIGSLDILTFGIGLALIGIVIVTGVLKRKKNRKLGIKLEALSLYITKIVFMIGIIFFISYTLAAYKGISYLLLITVVVVVIYHFMTTQTVLGRRIYAVGGNPDAAELSGISVNKILIIVFVSMGICALISGVMYVSMLSNTSPNHGPFWELYAIAAAFIGGTSASGGVGKVVNAVIGSITIMSLKNGMALAGVNSNIEPIVLGSVLLLAVVFDIYTRNIRSIDLVGVHYAKQANKDKFIVAKEEFDFATQELNIAKKNYSLVEKFENKSLAKDNKIEAAKERPNLLTVKRVNQQNAVKANFLFKHQTQLEEKISLIEEEIKKLEKSSKAESAEKNSKRIEKLKKSIAKISSKISSNKEKIQKKDSVVDLKIAKIEREQNAKLVTKSEEQVKKLIIAKEKVELSRKKKLESLQKKLVSLNNKMEKEQKQYDLKITKASEKKLDKLENIHLTKAVRLEDAKKKLSKTIASFEEKPNIVSFEYLYTNKQGIYNRIKDKIREAKEVDYTGLIESQN